MHTVPSRFLERADRSPEQQAFFVLASTDPYGGGTALPDHPDWRAYTLAEARSQVSGLARRLHALGVDDDVKVAILAETSHLWAATDLATLALGGVTVGIYPTLLGDQVAWQLRHSHAQVLIVEDQAQYDKIAPHLDDLPELRHVLSLHPAAAVPQLTPAREDVAFLRERTALVRHAQTATIVYTSGTTGEPKGAVLTHANFDAIIESSRSAIPTRSGDRSIVFLPLAHSLQRFALYRGLAEDIVGYYAPSIAALPETLQVARPHVLVTVPRMLEKIKATAEAKAAAKGPKAAAILTRAIAVGRTRNDHLRASTRVPLHIRAGHRLAEKLVYQKVRAALGGDIRVLISGGAALAPDVAEFFEAVGIQVREGWGLTETCAPATTNTEHKFRIGTVGLPMPGVEIAVASDGELLVRSPGNFIGYFEDEDATRAAFDDAGFFRTGDLGSVDKDGFVRITGRKKAIIVTAGGKNIAPAPLEKGIEGGLAGQVVVVGDERPYLGALIALDPEILASTAQAAGWPGDATTWAKHPHVRAALQARVDAANATLPRFQSVKRFAILPGPLTIEARELTPTLKLRRSVIRARHADLIDQLYTPAP